MLSLNIIYFHYQVNIIAQKGKRVSKSPPSLEIKY